MNATSRNWIRRVALLISTAASLAALAEGWKDSSQKQWPEYDADVPKTIVELQQFRESNSTPIQTGSGSEATATLINLNPH